MLVIQETFKKRIIPIYHPWNNVEDYKTKTFVHFLEFIKEVWVSEHSSRKKLYLPKIQFYPKNISFQLLDYETKEKQIEITLEYIKAFIVSYNSMDRTGRLEFDCNIEDIPSEARPFLKFGFNLDSENHISTCILHHFFEK